MQNAGEVPGPGSLAKQRDRPDPERLNPGPAYQDHHCSEEAGGWGRSWEGTDFVGGVGRRVQWCHVASRVSPAHGPDGSFQMSQPVGREQAFVRRAPKPRAAWGMIDLQ